VILNGHEYVACQARKAAITFTKEGNCFTAISDAAGLAKIAETLSEQRAIGRLSQVCERWIYTCVCFALDSAAGMARPVARPPRATCCIKNNEPSKRALPVSRRTAWAVRERWRAQARKQLLNRRMPALPGA
jgi:hypothetical protein